MVASGEEAMKRQAAPSRTTPILTVRFRKKRDGEGSMTCVRPDGTVTGQRSGPFFLSHDLGHYAIETTLGLRSAFFGMLARGWDIGDFGSPWPRGPIPPDAVEELALAESLAGMLDQERAGVPEYDADGLNRLLSEYFEHAGMTLRRLVAADELSRVRTALRELEARWDALPPGETLDLPFTLSSEPALLSVDRSAEGE